MIIVRQVPCIQFLDKDTQNFTVLDYVLIVRSGSANPCFSQLGRVGGEQRLGLNKKCFENDNIEKGVHELMHALGKHEVNVDCTNHLLQGLPTSKTAPIGTSISRLTRTTLRQDLRKTSIKDLGRTETSLTALRAVIWINNSLPTIEVQFSITGNLMAVLTHSTWCYIGTAIRGTPVFTFYVHLFVCLWVVLCSL